MAHPPTLDLRTLHLLAWQAGQATLVAAAGDAEGLLWAAPGRRVLRLHWRRAGVMASELHALLDDAGRPLAWWQRSVASHWTGRAGAVVPALPNATLHEVAWPLPTLGVAGDDERRRCHDAFFRMLANVAGTGPRSPRRAPEGRAPLRNRRACPPALRGGAMSLVP